MHFLKRAKTSVLKQPIKSIILLLLVFILSTVMLGAITVTTAIDNTDRAIRRRMSPIVTIWLDQDSVPYDITPDGGRTYHQVEHVTSNMVRQIAELPYVNRHYYSMNERLYTYDFDYYFTPDDACIIEGFDVCIFEDHGIQLLLNDGSTLWLQQGNFFAFRGTSDDEPIEMQEGVIELVAGSNFENFHVQQGDNLFPALVSRAFAEVNGLSIGSTFIMEREFFIWELFDWYANEPDISEGLWYISYEFEIVGLFEVVPTENTAPPGFEQVEPQRVNDLSNRIHVPNEVMSIIHEDALEEYRQLYREHGIESLTLELEAHDFADFRSFFVLNDPLELEQFREAALEILPELWDFDNLSNTFAAVSTSFETIRDISVGILWISTVATVLTLTLLMLLFLRDRRHEIGIYLALGESKRKIISQFLIEVIVIALIGITASIFAGNIIADRISREMLRNEIASQPSQVENFMMGSWGMNDTLFHLGFGTELTLEETLEIFDSSLSVSTILILYMVGLSVIIVSTIVPVLYVAKSNPKKILMQGRMQ